MDMEKERAKGKRRTAEVFGKKERHIHKEACLGKRKIYDGILSVIEEEGAKEGIETGGMHTDQHLLTDAFYFSALGNTHADIFTFDRDILNLLECSWSRVLSCLRRLSYSMMEQTNSLDVAVYKAGFYKNEFGFKFKRAANNRLSFGFYPIGYVMPGADLAKPNADAVEEEIKDAETVKQTAL